MSNHHRNRKKPPAGYDYIEPVLLTLENELRDKVRETNAGKRNTESMWPVLQIQHQRSRYVYDMHYVHHKISRKVLDYCIKAKIADAGLIAKWKKPGYERLCSTYVINPSNYKFGTTSICRVPHTQRREELKFAQDPTTGCLGCASGRGAGPKNIFGNKYGQRLAAIQVAREQKRQELEEKERLQRQMKEQAEVLHDDLDDNSDDADNILPVAEATAFGAGDSDTEDSSDDDDYGPSPAAGVWAGSEKLEKQSESLAFGGDDDDDDGDDETDDEEDNNSTGANDLESDNRPSKKAKSVVE